MTAFVLPGQNLAHDPSSTLRVFAELEVLARAVRALALAGHMLLVDLPTPSLHCTLALFAEAGLLAREPGGHAIGVVPRLRKAAAAVGTTLGERWLVPEQLRNTRTALTAFRRQPQLQTCAAPLCRSS